MVTSFLIHLHQLTPPNLDKMLLLDGPQIATLSPLSVYFAISTGLLSRADYWHSLIVYGMDGWMDGILMSGATICCWHQNNVTLLTNWKCLHHCWSPVVKLSLDHQFPFCHVACYLYSVLYARLPPCLAGEICVPQISPWVPIPSWKFHLTSPA